MKYYVKTLVILLLCTLVPCMTIFTATNYMTLAQYRQSLSDSQVNRLRAVSGAHKLIVENLEQSALRFSLDPSIQSLGSFTMLELGPQNNTYLRSLTRAMDMLRELVRTNSLFHSVYLHIDGSDYVISSRDSIIRLERFADLDWMEKYAELKENRRSDRMMAAHPITTGYDAQSGFDSYGRRCLTYVYPITPFTSNFYGTLVFNLFEDELMELYSGGEEGGNIAILDSMGNKLTQAGETGLSPELSASELGRALDPDAPDSGRFDLEVGKDRYQCSYFRTDSQRFVFLSVQNMSVLTRRAEDFQRVFVLFLLMFIPFVALITTLVSRRLYSPIGRLMRELADSGKLESGGEKDAWTAVSRAINELLREDRRLFSDSGREKLRDATFLRILAGDGELDEDVAEILPYPRRLCVIAALDAPAAEDANYDSRVRLLVRLIREALGGDGVHATAMLYEKNTIAALLSLEDAAENMRPVLERKIAACQEQAEAVTEYAVTFAVSGMLSDELSARQLFEQAKTVMQYSFILGTGSILYYDAIYPNIQPYSADERLRYIQHCLDAGKDADAVRGVKELVEDIKSKTYAAFIHVSQILNQLVTLLIQYAAAGEVRLDELLEGDMVIYRRLWQNRTLDEAAQWVCRMYEAAAEYRGAASAAGGEYVRQIKEYVHENYARDITIDGIAAHIGISYSYLRKLFKDFSGQNLADYINDLRIQKAKQLLWETNYTIKEIASICGYNHERSFSRAFAQAEKLSPGKYRAVRGPAGRETPDTAVNP